MAQRLRPVGPDFLERAPVRLVFGRDIAASPDKVFQALAEDVADMPRWFAAVASARAGRGGREIRLHGGIRFEEGPCHHHDKTPAGYPPGLGGPAPGPRRRRPIGRPDAAARLRRPVR
ncbi:hypothetical protein ACL07V_30035 [Streptomyces sp. MB22_4]|uniref:hypothetical protein n=1 Tax=Streptomyces sp. MB22_4 TaxID=3383120 RepID=UPI0039A38DD2